MWSSALSNVSSITLQTFQWISRSSSSQWSSIRSKKSTPDRQQQCPMLSSIRTTYALSNASREWLQDEEGSSRDESVSINGLDNEEYYQSYPEYVEKALQILWTYIGLTTAAGCKVRLMWIWTWTDILTSIKYNALFYVLMSSERRRQWTAEHTLLALELEFCLVLSHIHVCSSGT